MRHIDHPQPAGVTFSMLPYSPFVPQRDFIRSWRPHKTTAKTGLRKLHADEGRACVYIEDPQRVRLQTALHDREFAAVGRYPAE